MAEPENATGAIRLPGGSRARLSILYHHRVLPESDPLRPDTPDARLFDEWMRHCASVFHVLPVEEALDRLQAGTLPPRAACITFDDGYRDSFEVAMPILRRHGLTATFFIASGFLGNGRMFYDTVIEAVRRMPAGSLDLDWAGLGVRAIDDVPSRLSLIDDLILVTKYASNEDRDAFCDRLAASATGPLPTDLMMDPEQVRAMHHQGMTIGGHTVNHPILNEMPLEQARWEIESNRDYLASLIDCAPTLFAYPNGKPLVDYRVEHVDAVAGAGYRAAFTTAYGTARRDHDPFQLPRLSPWERSGLRFAIHMLRGPACNYPFPTRKGVLA